MNDTTHRIMINGEMTSDINVMDRGFQYGDGLFETMHVVNQHIPLWHLHWQRLKKGCDVLSIEMPDKAKLERDIACISSGVSKGVLKLIVTRGIGGRGYAVTEQIDPDVVLIQADYPNYPDIYWQEGIQTRLCETRLSPQPALAGIKHLNRLEQVLARNEWNDSNIAEGIMLDHKGNVIEGTMSNLFIVKEGKLLTPGLKLCGVAGVMRETVLTILAEENISCEITMVTQDMLDSADGVFLTNSVIGLWPVKIINDTVYSVSDVTRVLQQKINNIINNA